MRVLEVGALSTPVHAQVYQFMHSIFSLSTDIAHSVGSSHYDVRSVYHNSTFKPVYRKKSWFTLRKNSSMWQSVSSREAPSVFHIKQQDTQQRAVLKCSRTLTLLKTVQGGHAVHLSSGTCTITVRAPETKCIVAVARARDRWSVYILLCVGVGVKCLLQLCYMLLCCLPFFSMNSFFLVDGGLLFSGWLFRHTDPLKRKICAY